MYNSIYTRFLFSPIELDHLITDLKSVCLCNIYRIQLNELIIHMQDC